MLKHLSITNYAIIESLEIDLSDNFTVITGETGAGKSILLGALSLILGNRADTSVLNSKDKKCIVEGEFFINGNEYQSFFNKHDLDFDNQTIIRREISVSGKSRAFVNDTPVSLAILKELTSNLVDIHSQHETLQIKNNLFQIKVLDSYCKINNEVKQYTQEYNLFKQLEKELEDLQQQSVQAQEDVDYISFQVREIEALNLKPNEKETIEESLQVANNAEGIKKVIDTSANNLANVEGNVLEMLKAINADFADISNFSNEYQLISERLNSLTIELEDLAATINITNDDFVFDAENLSYLNERLSSIYAIEQKHKVNSTQEILDLLDTLNTKLQSTSSYEAKIEEKKKLVDGQKVKVLALAKKISNTRQKESSKIQKDVVNYLSGLGMPEATFKVDISTLDKPNHNGIDHVAFLFSANKGFEVKELSKVASGGELSRLMLVIKKFLSKGNNISTILFDEIDTGVSGDIADKMAELMMNIAKDVQVVAITHLPQVAAKGDVHLKISKQTTVDKTITTVNLLQQEKRVEELAKMLSGKTITKAAFDNAKVLLNN
jgi:DNA repair protein RecN (Recombination protein N)